MSFNIEGWLQGQVGFVWFPSRSTQRKERRQVLASGAPRGTGVHHSLTLSELWLLRCQQALYHLLCTVVMRTEGYQCNSVFITEVGKARLTIVNTRNT